MSEAGHLSNKNNEQTHEPILKRQKLKRRKKTTKAIDTPVEDQLESSRNKVATPIAEPKINFNSIKKELE